MIGREKACDLSVEATGLELVREDKQFSNMCSCLIVFVQKCQTEGLSCTSQGSCTLIDV